MSPDIAKCPLGGKNHFSLKTTDLGNKLKQDLASESGVDLAG